VTKGIKWSGYAYPAISLDPQVCGGKGVGKMRENLRKIFKIFLRVAIALVLIEFLTINVK